MRAAAPAMPPRVTGAALEPRWAEREGQPRVLVAALRVRGVRGLRDHGHEAGGQLLRTLPSTSPRGLIFAVLGGRSSEDHVVGGPVDLDRGIRVRHSGEPVASTVGGGTCTSPQRGTPSPPVLHRRQRPRSCRMSRPAPQSAACCVDAFPMSLHRRSRATACAMSSPNTHGDLVDQFRDVVVVEADGDPGRLHRTTVRGGLESPADTRLHRLRRRRRRSTRPCRYVSLTMRQTWPSRPRSAAAV